jgi:hypothetical protein
MKKLMIAAGLITLISAPAFAAPQDYSIDPNPAMSASSNDRSRDPAGVTTDHITKGFGQGATGIRGRITAATPITAITITGDLDALSDKARHSEHGGRA